MVCHNNTLVTAEWEFPTRLYSLDFEETPEAIAPGSSESRSQQESYWCSFIRSLCHFIKLQKLDEITKWRTTSQHFDNQESDQNSCASWKTFHHLGKMRSLWIAYIPCTKGSGKKRSHHVTKSLSRKEKKTTIQTSLEKLVKKAPPGINIFIYS